MRPATLHRLLGDARPPLWTRALRGGLSAASFGYRAAVALRNRQFDSGRRESYRGRLPVVSIGNLTTGGTGKSPLVAWLCERLLERSRTPLVLSRGYKSLADGLNDEGRQLELLVPSAIQRQHPDRTASLRAIEHELAKAAAPGVAVLDDGFQHRQLARDVDTVLVDATEPFGFGHVLPRGLLREPIANIRRADAVVITRCDAVEPFALASLRRRIRELHPATPVAEVAFRPAGFWSVDGAARPPAECLAFCGLGNPQGFAATLADAGGQCQELLTFPDHHHYEAADLDRIAAAAEGLPIATTLKDFVKLPAEWCRANDVRALRIAPEFARGERDLLSLVDAAIGRTATRRAA